MLRPRDSLVLIRVDNSYDPGYPLRLFVFPVPCLSAVFAVVLGVVPALVLVGLQEPAQSVEIRI